MNNLFLFVLIVWIAGQSFSFMMEGSTGITSTILTTTVTESSTTLAVHSTANFLPADFVVIGSEDICYTGITATTFTGLTRGCNGTDTSSHAAGTQVYTEPAGMLNKALGFTERESVSEGGFSGFIKGVTRTVGLPLGYLRLIGQMIIWDYAYLEGAAVYLKYYLLYPLSGVLVLSFVRMALGR